MKQIYKVHLFNKNILVNDSSERSQNPFELAYAFAYHLGIKFTEGGNLATLGLLKFATDQLGEYIPEPFYKGFPNTVKELTKDQLLFDQLFHYFTTYTLGDFDETKHSVMEQEFARSVFDEGTNVKEFKIVDGQNAVDEIVAYVKNLLASTRPLNTSQYQVVLEAIADFDIAIDQCPCKDTVISLLLDTEDVAYAQFLHLNDFVKLVEYLYFKRYGKVSIKKLNLKNKDRVLLTKVLDKLMDANFHVDSCMEKQQTWCGILHHLHYKPKTVKACKFVDAIRSGVNTSAYSRFEKFMANGDVKSAVDQLIKEKGSAGFLRKLNYVLSRCSSEENTKYVLENLKSDNAIVIIQLLLQYANYRSVSKRTFKFVRYNLMRVHAETTAEMVRRRSVIGKHTIQTIVATLNQTLADTLKGKLGNVYVDPDMAQIALPLQESASFTGYGNLPKGSKIKLPEGKKVRAFTYWEKVNDIDLSLMGLTKEGHCREFSWRTMYNEQSDAITFSGDQTSGYNGGSEYFDLDLDLIKSKYPNYRYFVLCNNVYSRVPFCQALCKAGFMMRDVVDSGEVFEPKTVESSYFINCDSTYAFLYAIDVENREVIWLNLARNSNLTVAGEDEINYLFDYFNVTDVINLYTYFSMLATNLVSDSANADVVVSDKTLQTKPDATVIRSCDTDVILALLNNKQ